MIVTSIKPVITLVTSNQLLVTLNWLLMFMLKGERPNEPFDQKRSFYRY